MRLIRIGIGNANPTVGAFRANTDQAIALADSMHKDGCTVGVLSEGVISGYPAEDFVQWRGFIDGQWQELERFAYATLGMDAVYVLGVNVEEDGGIYNCAAVVHAGNILGLVPKEKLPTYGVFFDGRTFARGIPYRTLKVNEVPFGDLIFKFPFGVMAVEVCEDIWSPDGPMRRRAYSGAELIVNISASPFRSGVTDTRREMISTRAADNCVTIAYANQLGGNDALVMDGGGYVNQGGRMILEAPRWRHGYATAVVDLDRTRRQRVENTTWRWDRDEYLEEERGDRRVTTITCPGPEADPDLPYPLGGAKNSFMPASVIPRNPRDVYFEDLLQAMAWGLGDYFDKTQAFRSFGIALSGGKDSSLVLLIAAYVCLARKSGNDPMAAKNLVHCFSMPTRFNSETTKSIARDLAESLGVTFVEVPIEEAVAANAALVSAMNLGGPIPKIAAQNIQARTRGEAMWNWTNLDRGMWIQTGNMSEKAVGYTTIGGDMQGAYGLIGNMPKTVVIALLHALTTSLDLQKRFPEIPQKALDVLATLLATKASAELDLNQEDERDLMPFPVLDACFALFAGEKLMPAEVKKVIRDTWTDEELRAMDRSYEPGHIDRWVDKFVRLFFNSIYKWVQSPETVHLGSLDLDRERALQLPSVNSRQWVEDE